MPDHLESVDSVKAEISLVIKLKWELQFLFWSRSEALRGVASYMKRFAIMPRLMKNQTFYGPTAVNDIRFLD